MILDALQGRNFQGRPPIWLMRQAGRYLPEYRKIRANYPLLEMFHKPDVIREVTMQPMRRFGLDAAILFSDILTVLDGLGVPYDFHEKRGPQISFTKFSPTPAYDHVKEAIYQLKQELDVPLLGFSGGPFTVLSYIIEGETSRQFQKIKKLMIQEPQKFDELLDQVMQETIRYLELQIEAGVDAVQIFESWAHALPPFYLEKYVVQPLKKIVQSLRIPTLLFCRGPALPQVGATALSVDWNGDIVALRKSLGPTIALQGNLDPMILYGSKEVIRYHVNELLGKMGQDPGYIFNLGHGVLPDTPVENVHYLVELVQSKISQTRTPLHELSHSP
ncbi:MAG: uroporphyrinogen decarboxylase [Chlamydiales bacterium]